MATAGQIQIKVCIYLSLYMHNHVSVFLFAQFWNQNTLRNQNLHNKHCEYVERKNIEKSEKRYFSTTFGVNRKSALAKFDGFDITDQLPQDIMHLFLEGVCVLHTAVLLKYLIYEEKLLTLDVFNLKVKTYKYLYFETKPTSLSVHAVKEHYMNGT